MTGPVRCNEDAARLVNVVVRRPSLINGKIHRADHDVVVRHDEVAALVLAGRILDPWRNLRLVNDT